jgi:hypothetical protein
MMDSSAVISITIVALLLLAIYFVIKRCFLFVIKPLFLKWLSARVRTRWSVVALIVALLSVWFVLELRWAKHQREAVEALRQCGVDVVYDYETDLSFSDMKTGQRPEPLSPEFLRNLLGIDFFCNVVAIRQSDSRHSKAIDLSHIEVLPHLRGLDLDETNVDDVALIHLRRATRLKGLCLGDTRISDAGLENIEGLTRLRFPRLRNT